MTFLLQVDGPRWQANVDQVLAQRDDRRLTPINAGAPAIAAHARAVVGPGRLP